MLVFPQEYGINVILQGSVAAMGLAVWSFGIVADASIHIRMTDGVSDVVI